MSSTIKEYRPKAVDRKEGFWQTLGFVRKVDFASFFYATTA